MLRIKTVRTSASSVHVAHVLYGCDCNIPNMRRIAKTVFERVRKTVFGLMDWDIP